MALKWHNNNVWIYVIVVYNEKFQVVPKCCLRTWSYNCPDLIPPAHPRKKLNRGEQCVDVLHVQKHQMRFVITQLIPSRNSWVNLQWKELRISFLLIPENLVLFSEATNNDWEIEILLVLCLFFSIFHSPFFSCSNSRRFDVHTIQFCTSGFNTVLETPFNMSFLFF